MRNIQIGIIGCGYVADFYMATLSKYPGVQVLCVHDRNEQRMKEFSNTWGLDTTTDISSLMSSHVDVILNLTNPSSHYAINKMALEAGKHVYCEKPFGTNIEEVRELVLLANQRGLVCGSAPCLELSPAIQELKKRLDSGIIGEPLYFKAVYHAFLTHKANVESWRSKSGAIWPASDEFLTGCVLEHIGYPLAIAIDLFGEPQLLGKETRVLESEKGFGVVPELVGSDFSSAFFQHKDRKVLSHLEASLFQLDSRELVVVGELGSLYVKDFRDDYATVHLLTPKNDKFTRVVVRILRVVSESLARALRFFGVTVLNDIRIASHTYKVTNHGHRVSSLKPVDFCRWVPLFRQAIDDGNTRLSINRRTFQLNKLMLQVNEL